MEGESVSAEELEQLIRKAAELRKEEHLHVWAQMAQAEIDRIERQREWRRRDVGRDGLPKWRRIWERVFDPMPS